MHPLIPLFLLFLFLCVFGLIAYAFYAVANDVKDKTVTKMQKKNVTVTKDGMRVGVREVREEEYIGGQQRSVLTVMLSMYLWEARGETWMRRAERRREKQIFGERSLATLAI